MKKQRALEFVEELKKLQKKYKIRIEAVYEEELDYDYNGNSYVSGVNSALILTNDQGDEISINEIEDEYFSCSYCYGLMDTREKDFCCDNCERIYKEIKGGQ